MPPTTAPAPNNNPAPTTDYGDAYNELGNVYDPETAQVQTQINALPGQQATAQASIDQAKANAFKDNSLNANSRGVLFGGVVPQANQDYTTSTYNPAVTKLNTDTANTQQSLAEKIQEINQNRANAAQTLVSDTTTANNEAAARAASEAASAASAAKTAASAAVPTANEIAGAIRGGLAKVTGGNGYVSPEDYAAAYIDWLNNGQSAASFDSAFKSFRDPTNGYYNYAIAQAIKRAS